MRPAWVVGAGHRVHAPDGLGHLRGVRCVGLHHGQALAQGNLGRVAGQGCDAVAALQQFIQQCGAYKAGGANQCDVHGVFLQGE